ncbi:MAG: type I-C CRISPR-associated protein Cas8c/Csd1, partial [Deferribacteraceae bacterium]|nr:type I-C CRISPR-associated protein Cas8c/Csd1 [Deferribacteraceae bacterium]
KNGKSGRFIIGVFAPKELSDFVYGNSKTKNRGIRKEIVKRLLPCIADREKVPADIVKTAVAKASNPYSLEDYEWKNCLAAACALYRSHIARENGTLYSLSLEAISSRDYL